MMKKLFFFLLLSLMITQTMQAQFGLQKAIKNKIDKNKEPEQKASTPTSAEPKKAEKTPEEIEAELKKVTFPEKGMNDPELEKRIIEVMSRSPGYYNLDDMNQLKVLHITSYDWTVKKDKYGSIEALILWVCIGYQKGGKCIKKEFYFKRDYLGGSEYQKSFLGVIPYSYTTSYEKDMSCEVLNALAEKEKPVVASKPTTSASTAKTTPPVKTTTASNSSTNTTKPATTSTHVTTSAVSGTLISLTPLGINATMNAPKGTEVIKDGDFRIIRSGNVDVQAEVTTLTLTEMKADVKTNDMYNGTGKILASNLNGFIFSCVEEGEDEKRVHLEFFKTIGGKKYRFIDDRLSEAAYTLADLQPFLDALNTIK